MPNLPRNEIDVFYVHVHVYLFYQSSLSVYKVNNVAQAKG